MLQPAGEKKTAELRLRLFKNRPKRYERRVASDRSSDQNAGWSKRPKVMNNSRRAHAKPTGRNGADGARMEFFTVFLRSDDSWLQNSAILRHATRKLNELIT
jgi:hypothetical protein